MSKISIEVIKNELKKGWKILSSEYENLDSILTFECPEGHQVTTSWKKMRTKPICPTCEQNQFKIKDTKIIPKNNKHRILALDQASHDCGWSIFDDKHLVKYGVFHLSNDKEEIRINKLKHWLISMISNWKPDYVGLEGIQYQDEVAGKAKMGITVFQTLARLQGVLRDTCIEAQIPCEICPTNTWRAACGVKGKTRADRKKSMQLLVKNWCDITVPDDIADAIGIGKYLSDKINKQIEIENWE